MEKKMLNFDSVSEIKYNCSLCKGKTKIENNAICPRCKGKGYISKHVKPGNYHEHSCNICSGTGYNPFNKTECLNCQGTGKIIINVEKVTNAWNYS